MKIPILDIKIFIFLLCIDSLFCYNLTSINNTLFNINHELRAKKIRSDGLWQYIIRREYMVLLLTVVSAITTPTVSKKCCGERKIIDLAMLTPPVGAYDIHPRKTSILPFGMHFWEEVRKLSEKCTCKSKNFTPTHADLALIHIFSISYLLYIRYNWSIQNWLPIISRAIVWLNYQKRTDKTGL